MPLDLDSIFGRRADFVWREVHWPAELPPQLAVAVLRQLGTNHFVPLIALEVEARDGVVLHRIGVPAPAAARVEQLFTTLVYNSALTTGTRRTELPDAFRIMLTNRHRPLQVSDDYNPPGTFLFAAEGSGCLGSIPTEGT